MKNIDAFVKNLAPDADCIKITIGEWTVTVERDLLGDVFVAVEDGDTRCLYVLGDEGETQVV